MTLTCPSDPNMAAVAKQMHATALQAEAEIFLAEQQMRDAVNHPTVVRTTTATFTGMSANVDYFLDFATWVTIFDNTDGGDGFSPANSGFFTAKLGEGIYEVGFYANMIASGAVDDNTLRSFAIQHVRPDPSSAIGLSVIQLTGYTLFETNTGIGVDACLVGEFRAQPQDSFQFLFQHANTSSTLNMSIGALMWATKLSESNLTRVVI